MANNAYYSRLKKECEKVGKVEDFEKGYELLMAEISEGQKKPSIEDEKKLFEKLGVPFPQMGAKKLTDEEIKAKHAEDKEKLLLIFDSGTKEEKDKLQSIIDNHQKEMEKERAIKELKDTKSKLTKLGLNDDDIKKELGL